MLVIMTVHGCCHLADLEDEQALRTQHQDADDDEQREHLRHRAREEEFQRRLRLRDREAPRRSCRAGSAAPPNTTTRNVSTM